MDWLSAPKKRREGFFRVFRSSPFQQQNVNKTDVFSGDKTAKKTLVENAKKLSHRYKHRKKNVKKTLRVVVAISHPESPFQG